MKRLIEAGLLLGAGIVASCASDVVADKSARPVRVEKVRGEVAEGGLRYSATIQPYEQVPLSFKVGGYVSDVRRRQGPDGRPRNLQQGDLVTRGTVLARVNPADYQEKVNQARAQLAEAEASLKRAEADAGRAEALYRGKALTRPDYDAALANMGGAVARADAARAQLEAARLSLRDASLVAPSDGVVLSRSVEVGTLAAAGTVGFTLADLTRVKAVFGVPDHLVQRVEVGTELRVTSDAFPGVEFPGRVTAVSPSADAQSRVFNVEVTIPNAARQLKAGMVASVDVVLDTTPPLEAGSPTVSVAAIVKSSRPGAFAVFLADGPDDAAVARARDVSLGRIAGNRVAVASGLRVDDRVIVSGASQLVDGDRVRVIPGGEAE
jgi:multidrug efflux system membrane fusion protein